MSEGMNKVILLGNLGDDSELRFTQGGQPVLNFRMATTESWADKDGDRKERTDWHSVVLWGKRGEALEKYLVKGCLVLVEGKLRTESYEKDGEKRYSTKVHADDIKLCGGGARDERRDDDRDGRRPRDDRDDGKGRGRDDRGDSRERDSDRRRDDRDRDRGRGRDDDRRERSSGRPADNLPY